MPKWTIWLQSLQPVCKQSGSSWDAYAGRSDPFANAEVRELTFAPRPDPLEDVRDLKCAYPDPHLARPDGT
jgi:hypothetical protein